MNDTLRYMRHDPIHRKYHHDELTFSLIYAFHENFVPAAVARRSRPRQGLAAGPDARRPVAEVRQPAAAVRLHVDATRARSCCSWGASSASGTSGITTTACNGTCCSGIRTSGLQQLRGRPESVYRREPALHQVDFDYHRLRVDRLPQLRGQRAELHPPRPRIPATFSSSAATSRRSSAAGYRLGVPEALLVRGNLQQRLDVLRRQQRGQRSGRDGRATAEPRAAGLDRGDAAPAGHGGLQAAAVRGARPAWVPLLACPAVLLRLGILHCWTSQQWHPACKKHRHVVRLVFIPRPAYH